MSDRAAKTKVFFVVNDMKDFYLNNIRLCQHCSKCPPKTMTVLDKKTENYCETGIGVDNPTEQQYEYIKKFVMLRKDHIKKKVKHT